MAQGEMQPLSIMAQWEIQPREDTIIGYGTMGVSEIIWYGTMGDLAIIGYGTMGDSEII